MGGDCQWARSPGRQIAPVRRIGVIENDRGTVVQSQAQTRHVHPAPQVETAEAVACW
jgi:hypothetical protein